MKVPVYKRQVDMTMETGSRDLTASLNPNAMAAPAIALAGVGKQIMSIAGQKFQHDQAEKKIKDDTELNTNLSQAQGEFQSILVEAAQNPNPLAGEDYLKEQTKKIADKYKNKFTDQKNFQRFVFKLNNFTGKSSTQFFLNNVERKSKFISESVEKVNEQNMIGVTDVNLPFSERINNLTEMVTNLKNLKDVATPVEIEEKINTLKISIAKDIMRNYMEGSDDPEAVVRDLIDGELIFDKDGATDNLLTDVLSTMSDADKEDLEDDLLKESKKMLDLQESELKREQDETKKQIGILVNKVINKEDVDASLDTLREYVGLEGTGFSLTNLEKLLDWVDEDSESTGKFRKAGQYDIKTYADLTNKAQTNTLTIPDVLSSADKLDKSSFESFMKGIIGRRNEGEAQSHAVFNLKFNYQKYKNTGNDRVDALTQQLSNKAKSILRDIEYQREQDGKPVLKGRERYETEDEIVKKVKADFKDDILEEYVLTITNYLESALSSPTLKQEIDRRFTLDTQNPSKYIDDIVTLKGQIPNDEFYMNEIQTLQIYKSQFEIFLRD
jgi:hypothetical protein